MADVNLNNVPTNSGLAGNGYLIIIGGQSNGTDRFTISNNLPVAQQGSQNSCYTYFKTSDAITDNGSWVQMNAGVNTQTGTPQTGSFGISVVMANRLRTTHNKLAFVVPTAVGGTYIANDVTPSWNISHVGEYYDKMLKHAYRFAYSKIGGINITPVLVWVHGESDTDTVAHGQAYQANLTNLINQFRADCGFPNIKVIITRLRSDYTGSPRLGLSDVRAAQLAVASALTGVYIYDTETALTPLSSDGQHYNPITGSYGGVQSAINLGEGLADLIATF